MFYLIDPSQTPNIHDYHTIHCSHKYNRDSGIWVHHEKENMALHVNYEGDMTMYSNVKCTSKKLSPVCSAKISFCLARPMSMWVTKRELHSNGARFASQKPKELLCDKIIPRFFQVLALPTSLASPHQKSIASKNTLRWVLDESLTAKWPYIYYNSLSVYVGSRYQAQMEPWYREENSLVFQVQYNKIWSQSIATSKRHRTITIFFEYY